MNTIGRATVMGTFPYPPNGIVEIDYEFIHIFKKPGRREKVPASIKEASRLTKEEWKTFFKGHWNFRGTKQIGHEAMFPDELPRRLIKMFSFVEDTVLDPFLGSGTTIKVALQLKRHAIGYEINKEFLPVIKEKLGIGSSNLWSTSRVEIIDKTSVAPSPVKTPTDYTPRIQNAMPQIDPGKFRFNNDRLYRVARILDEGTLLLQTGLIVKFLGVKIVQKEAALRYLNQYLLGKQIYLKFPPGTKLENGSIATYVYLKNKIFINAYLIQSGMGIPDTSRHHLYEAKFLKLHEEVENG